MYNRNSYSTYSYTVGKCAPNVVLLVLWSSCKGTKFQCSRNRFLDSSRVSKRRIIFIHRVHVDGMYKYMCTQYSCSGHFCNTISAYLPDSHGR
jgi:hypothetical protein